jgi:hypothetical protein
MQDEAATVVTTKKRLCMQRDLPYLQPNFNQFLYERSEGSPSPITAQKSGTGLRKTGSRKINLIS